MKLNLERPLVFFDLETTGLNIGQDKIVELSMLKVNENGDEEIRTMLINPGIPIPRECSEVHGIWDMDVKDMPRFEEVADDILSFIGDADLAGFNSNKFDVPLLVEEFLRCERHLDFRNRRLIDVQNIFHKMEPRNLAAAYKLYCGKSLDDAHQAEADTRATYEVLKAQLDKYQNVEYQDKKTGRVSCPVQNDVRALSSFSTDSRHVDFAGHIVFNDNDEEIFNFGKHRGKTVEYVFRSEPQYYDWMMKSDFPLYTKEVITRIKNRMF